MKRIALVVCLAGLSPILWAADGIPTGTWVRRANKDGITSTVIVEAAGTGQKFTFKVRVGGATSTMIVTTQWDGKDAPVYVDGKPSGETMAIRMVDDSHITNILKMDGKAVSTQKSEVSADGKVIKTETLSNTPGVPGTFEYWDKK